MDNGEVVRLGSKYIWGLPEGQSILMTKTMYQNIEIYAERDPIGTQMLRTEDIIEELNKIPRKLLKYVFCIVLSPLDNPLNSHFTKKYSVPNGIKSIAMVDSDMRQISIFKQVQNCDRNGAKSDLSENMTIIHEIGHLLDSRFGQGSISLSKGEKWRLAMEEDASIKGIQASSPEYYVPGNARIFKDIGEDFADTFKYFMNDITKSWFVITFPNRNKILEELWKIV